VQAIEIRSAVNAEQHRLAVDHEGRVPIARRSLDDQRVSPAPVVATAREQTHALAVALDDKAVAVELDLVNPFRAVRDLGAAARNAGLERRFGHTGYLGDAHSRCQLRPVNSRDKAPNPSLLPPCAILTAPDSREKDSVPWRIFDPRL
jgi:hypothetical protein